MWAIHTRHILIINDKDLNFVLVSPSKELENFLLVKPMRSMLIIIFLSGAT